MLFGSYSLVGSYSQVASIHCVSFMQGCLFYPWGSQLNHKHTVTVFVKNKEYTGKHFEFDSGIYYE